MFAEVVASHAQIAKRFLDAQKLSGSLQALSLNMSSEKYARICQRRRSGKLTRSSI
jgi:hypothetical protein